MPITINDALLHYHRSHFLSIFQLLLYLEEYENSIVDLYVSQLSERQAIRSALDCQLFAESEEPRDKRLAFK